MKLFFAGYNTCPKILEVDKDIGVLTSYIECRKKHIPDVGKDLILDSGAFSAMTRNINIDLDEYIEYIRINERYITTYANLDVIGNAQASNDNQEYMERAGLNPLPTFHYGSDYDHLVNMVRKYDHIGLGGLVPIIHEKNKVANHLSSCWRIILDNNPKCKVHGWGLASQWALTKYPFYSVDSTTWLAGGKFRRRVTYKNNKLHSCNDKQANKPYSYENINMHNAHNLIKLVEQADKVWRHRKVGYYAET